MEFEILESWNYEIYPSSQSDALILRRSNSDQSCKNKYVLMVLKSQTIIIKTRVGHYASFWICVKNAFQAP